MFSGIIEESATVVSIDRQDGICNLVVKSQLPHSDTELGDSIAIDGVCLTVTEIGEDGGTILTFQLSEETLRRSTLGRLRPGTRVHCERSLVIGDRVHGHFVFGHVDGIATLQSQEQEGESRRLVWSYPKELGSCIAPKGSVALAGVSLTVGEVLSETFSVYIIPHTHSVTKLGKLEVGEVVNLEVDMLARYVHRALSLNVCRENEQGCV